MTDGLVIKGESIWAGIGHEFYEPVEKHRELQVFLQSTL